MVVKNWDELSEEDKSYSKLLESECCFGIAKDTWLKIQGKTAYKVGTNFYGVLLGNIEFIIEESYLI